MSLACPPLPHLSSEPSPTTVAMPALLKALLSSVLIRTPLDMAWPSIGAAMFLKPEMSPSRAIEQRLPVPPFFKPTRHIFRLIFILNSRRSRGASFKDSIAPTVLPRSPSAQRTAPALQRGKEIRNETLG